LTTDKKTIVEIDGRKIASGKALTKEGMKKYRWLNPKLVAQLEFTDWKEANHLRHAKFLGLREDKNPRDVTILALPSSLDNRRPPDQGLNFV